jgi:hypothetical protein
MAETYQGEVRNGVIVLEPIPGRPLLPDGTRVRVEVARPLPVVSEPVDDDPCESTRAWLLAAASEAEANAPPMPSDLAEKHDHYAHGRPRT